MGTIRREGFHERESNPGRTLRDFTFDLNQDVNSVTSFGGQLYRRDYAHVYAYGENFPVPGLSGMSATTQSRVNSELRLKHTPQLTFEYDPTVERGVRLSRLIDELNSDETT